MLRRSVSTWGAGRSSAWQSMAFFLAAAWLLLTSGVVAVGAWYNSRLDRKPVTA